MTVCLASHNKNKIRELKEMLSDRYQIIGLEELGLKEEIPETGATLEENSMIKARHVYDKYHIPVIADDSGLLVAALGGSPGVYSARYAGPEKEDEKNIQLLLKNLGDSSNREARFETVITYIDEQGQDYQFSGTIEGEIRFEKSGGHGFGYDPIFQPKGYDLTFAELAPEVKNRISHRAKAVEKLINYLNK